MFTYTYGWMKRNGRREDGNSLDNRTDSMYYTKKQILILLKIFDGYIRYSHFVEFVKF